jgi:hypothetical protein
MIQVQWYTATNSAMNWLRETEPPIIFVMAKKQAEELARELGIIFIHSELSDAERRKRIATVASGQARCVATSSIGQ